MSNPPKPLVPNITTGPQTGRLATDRYDFEAHVEGTAFRHQANQIDLFPTLVISGSSQPDVQSALTALAAAVLPPVINDATTTVKGILKLAGDLGGTASSVTVTGIQGKPISNLAPSTNNVLTWNGVAWAPSPATNSFSAAGDLAGNNVLQQVIGLTGAPDGHGFNVVNSAANKITFNSSVTAPTIDQTANPIGNGEFLTINAQPSSAFGFTGGEVIISGGSSAGGLNGGVQLGIAGSTLFQVTQQVSGQRVAAVSSMGISSTEMPAGTGDVVMFIENATTAPTTGNPTNGAILYALGGQLRVKQQDGQDFSIGSIPNPSIWGSAGQQTYTQRSYVSTTSSSPTLAFSYTIPDLTSVKVDVMIIGKQVGAAESAQFNLAWGLVRNGSTPAGVGTVTSADPRTTTGAAAWAAPYMLTAGNNLEIFTGANASTVINWFVVVQLTLTS